MNRLIAYFQIKENQIIALCALLHLAVSFGTDRLAFTAFSFFYTPMKLLFGLLLFLLWKGGFYVVRLLRNGDTRAWTRLRLFAFYFGLSMVLMVLIWPGNWTNDDVIIYDNSASLVDFNYWQHFLTSVFYIFSLMLLPFPAGIVIIQLVILSFIIADCIAWVYEKTGKRKSAFLLFIPFFFFPVLLENYHPLRLILCAYFDLYLMKTFAVRMDEKKPLRPRQLILPAVLIILLAVWRSENIYYALLMPLLFVLAPARTMTRKQKLSFCASVLSVSLVLTMFQNVQVKKEGNYSDTGLTAFMALYFRAEEEGDTEFTDAVEGIYSKRTLYWGRDNHKTGGNLLIDYQLKRAGTTKADERRFKTALIKAIFKYPDTFLAERCELFFNSYLLLTDMHDINNPGERYERIDGYFHEHGLLTDSPFPTLRYSILTGLYMHPDQQMRNHSTAFKIVWSQVPPMVLLTLCALVLLLKKKFAYAALLLIALLKNLLVFASAPYYYFMYYFPVYLCGYAVTAALVYFAVVRAKERKKTNPAAA